MMSDRKFQTLQIPNSALPLTDPKSLWKIETLKPNFENKVVPVWIPKLKEQTEQSSSSGFKQPSDAMTPSLFLAKLAQSDAACATTFS